MNKTELEVSKIENGTVIDHIPSENLFKVMKLLRLNDITNRITLGTNLESQRIGKKAIIKVADLYIDEESINNIIAFAPKARVSYIENFDVTRKVKLSVPDTITGNIKCANPMCITNHENVETHFTVVDKESLSLRCHYCEKITRYNQFTVVL